MITGSLVALITPMHNNGDVDYEALKKLVEWHVAEGTDGIVAVGTTGESATLSVEEHLEVIRVTVEAANSRVPVIAGTGANSTQEACELTQEAARLGVDACLLVVPYYNKPSQQGMYLHFKAISEASEVNQILYNVPGRTACDMLADTVARLSELKNVIGIKEATGDIERGREIKRLVSDEQFAIYSGDDATFIDLMEVGAVGDISVTANVAPRRMHQICEAALAGDFAKARELNSCLEALHSDLFVEANPIPVKWACQQMGLSGPAIRLPMTELDPQYHDCVAAALKKAELI